MSWHHGNCKVCGERSEDEVCGRCDFEFEAERAAEEDRVTAPPTTRGEPK